MVRAVLALVVILPALAGAQDKIELNRITRVEVKDGSVAITGSRTPNFNTFTMTDPPRLVIDISEAVFSGVPEVIAGQGVITGVKTASYGSASSAIARVLVGFDREVETDLTTQGTTVTVKVLGGAPSLAQSGATGATGQVVAQAEPPDQATQKQAAADAEKRAQDDRAAQQDAAQKSAAAAEAARQQEEAARQKAEEAARAEAQRAKEAQQRAEEARKAEEAAQRKAAQEAARRAEEERKQQEEAARKAEEAARKEAAREAAERAQREAEAKKAQLAAEKEAARKAAEDRRREAEEAKRAEVAAKKAAEEERQRQLAEEREAKKAAEAERRRQLEEARKAEAASKQAALEARRAEEKAEREAKARAADDRRSDAAEARRGGGAGASSGGRRTLELVGFRPRGQNARVTITTDDTAAYELREADETTVIVSLPNTRIGAHNNALSLDTSFFGTPVLRVNPTQVGGDVEVEITLKAPVPYQAKQQGNDLVLEFQAR